MSAAYVRSLADRLGIAHLAGTFVFFRCPTCGHEQHHWVPFDDERGLRNCGECGQVSI